MRTENSRGGISNLWGVGHSVVILFIWLPGMEKDGVVISIAVHSNVSSGGFSCILISVRSRFHKFKHKR